MPGPGHRRVFGCRRAAGGHRIRPPGPPPQSPFYGSPPPACPGVPPPSSPGFFQLNDLRQDGQDWFGNASAFRGGGVPFNANYYWSTNISQSGRQINPNPSKKEIFRRILYRHQSKSIQISLISPNQGHRHLSSFGDIYTVYTTECLSLT